MASTSPACFYWVLFPVMISGKVQRMFINPTNHGFELNIFLRMYFSTGVEVYCAPTADARGSWQASMLHIAMEGGCFVLSANQFCRRKDYPSVPEYTFGGFGDQEPSPDTVVCAGGSVIMSPTGNVIAGPNYEGEALLVADIGKRWNCLANLLLGENVHRMFVNYQAAD